MPGPKQRQRVLLLLLDDTANSRHTLDQSTRQCRNMQEDPSALFDLQSECHVLKGVPNRIDSMFGR